MYQSTLYEMGDCCAYFFQDKHMFNIISNLVWNCTWTLILYMISCMFNAICKFSSRQVALNLSNHLPALAYLYIQKFGADLISIFMSSVLLKWTFWKFELDHDRREVIDIALWLRNIIKILIVAICIVNDRYLHRITMVCIWGAPYMIYGHHHKASRRRWMQ